MTEAAAAFYAVETLVEGAAVGAFAVSKSTTPLHVRFRKLAALPPIPPWDSFIGSSADIVKGKAYIFGGDATGLAENLMKIVILPSDIESGEIDYTTIEPEFTSVKPLQKYSDPSTANVSGRGNADIESLESRSLHASTNIDANVFILAGRRSQTIGRQSLASGSSELFDCNQILSFSTQTNKWTRLAADVDKCTSGVPKPRTGASCTSTSHPQPDSTIEITSEFHGTVFLHGGYDAQGNMLRDTWAFDVSSRVWTRWPDLPEPSPEEIAGEGRITCVGDRLWCMGDGFGKMMYIDFDTIRSGVVGAESGPHLKETGLKLSSDKWESYSFGDKAARSTLLGEIGAGTEKPLVEKTETLPVPRQGAGLVPVKVGAGRIFLLYFMGQDGPGSLLGDVWSFQVQSEEKTPAAAKDIIRNALGKETGENKWARCEVIESTKGEGQVFPPRGLAHFAVDNWKDLGEGNVLIWGGIDAPGQVNRQSWIMSVE